MGEWIDLEMAVGGPGLVQGDVPESWNQEDPNWGNSTTKNKSELYEKLVFENLEEVKNYAMNNPGTCFTRNPDGIGFVIKNKKLKNSSEKIDIDTKCYDLERVRIGSICPLGSAWSDLHTGLTWVIHKDLEDIFTKNCNDMMNHTSFLGHSDWRIPSLRELRSLSTKEKIELGNLCIKTKYGGPIFRGRWWSSNKCKIHGTKMAWNFDGNYPEKQIKEYGISEFKGGGGAYVIYVRGNVNYSSDWISSLNKWIEDNDRYDFPLFEKDILNIEELYIDKEPIPIEMRNLVNLKKLKLETLGHTNSTQSNIFTINSLEELSVRENCFPDCIGDESNPLEFIPDSLGSMDKLRILELSAPNIRKLPNSIGKLFNLKSFTGFGLSVEEIPNSICFLHNLEVLNLGFTSIKKMPDNIGDLLCLEELRLRGTKIKSLPSSIGSLVNLEVLDLGRTQIKSLPLSIIGLCNLKELYLDETEIDHLPEWLGSLSNMTYLVISGTKVECLPESISSMLYLDVVM